jgi:hypothetical protein
MADKTVRAIPCVVCRNAVEVDTYTTASPDMPAMFIAAAGAAFGIAWPPREPPTLIVTCAEECLRRFMRGDWPRADGGSGDGAT